MPRLTLAQISTTLIPETIGYCSNDYTRLAQYLNEAQQNLIFAGGETGFYGGWQRVVFNVDPENPYIVCPREIARLVNADVYRHPVRISNEWMEFLPGGGGMRQQCTDRCGQGHCRCGKATIWDRGVFPPLELSDQYLRVYAVNTADYGKRVLISKAKDENGNYIYTFDSGNQIDGFYLTLTAPFTTSTYKVSSFNNILKDATYGEVILKQVDPDTTDEVTIARFQSDETTPAYRKYYIHDLPSPCDGETTVPVTALAKLEFIPLVRSTDFLLISNVPALRAECEAIKYRLQDTPQAIAMADAKHREAIKLLQNEQRHYFGSQTPAISQVLSGLEGLKCKNIGYMQ